MTERDSTVDVAATADHTDRELFDDIAARMTDRLGEDSSGHDIDRIGRAHV